jgi:hypothetical protein
VKENQTMRIYKSNNLEKETMCTGTIYKFKDRWFFRYILMFDDEYTEIPVNEESIPKSKWMSEFYSSGVRVNAQIVTKQREDGSMFDEAILAE